MESDESKDMFSAIRNGITAIPELLFSTVSLRVSQEADWLLSKVEAKTYQIQEQVIKAILSNVAMGIGALFMLLAFLFLLTDIFEISRPLAYFMIGIIVLIAGMLLKPKTR